MPKPVLRVSSWYKHEGLVTHSFRRFSARLEVFFVQNVVYHISKPCSKIRILKPSFFQLKFETHVNAEKQCILPALQHSEYRQHEQQYKRSFIHFRFGKSNVFFPGCRQAGQTIAALPSNIDSSLDVDWSSSDVGMSSLEAGSSSSKRWMEPARLRSWRWLQMRNTNVISLYRCYRKVSSKYELVI